MRRVPHRLRYQLLHRKAGEREHRPSLGCEIRDERLDLREELQPFGGRRRRRLAVAVEGRAERVQVLREWAEVLPGAFGNDGAQEPPRFDLLHFQLGGAE